MGGGGGHRTDIKRSVTQDVTKTKESEYLHFSVDFVAKSIAAKLLWLNCTCLKVQNIHVCVPRIS